MCVSTLCWGKCWGRYDVVYGWHSDNSVFLENAAVYLRPGVYSVVVLEESPCPRASSRTNFQVLVLVLVLESQVIDNKKLSYRRETARQLHTSFSAHSLIVHFTEHHICFTSI